MDAIIDVLLAHPLLAILGLFASAAMASDAWQMFVRPMLTPKATINAMADELIARYGAEADDHAYIAEDRAWRYCETFQQGLWRRVRRELRRRQLH